MTIPDTSVLFVIDAQNGFVNEHTKHVIPAIGGLVDRWRSAGGDLVFTRFVNYPDSPWERLVGWTEMQGEGLDTDLVPELERYATRPAAVVDKTTYTALAKEGRLLVKAHGWTDLYLCGVDTDCCVLKSAADAFEAGLTPWVVADACASSGGADANDAGLRILRRLIGTARSSTCPPCRPADSTMSTTRNPSPANSAGWRRAGT